ncbi:MAG TPA: ATP-binding protein, partial [Clostridia bacterium]|nr:ATP-binding protein [Clostridia bacterium]
EIHVDEVLNNEKIPAILLQPLVENAVRHGIAPYNIDGRIFVRIERERDLIVIRVGDNGGGMEPDMLKALADMWENIRNDPMRVKEDTRNVGLRNIMKRLSLLYGKRASFVIESAKGGTTITIGYPPAL